MASILIVDEGSSFGAELVGRLFGAGEDVFVASTAAAALQRLAGRAIDVVFVQHRPPTCDALALVRAAHATNPALRFVVAGNEGKGSAHDGVHSMAGADLDAQVAATAVLDALGDDSVGHVAAPTIGQPELDWAASVGPPAAPSIRSTRHKMEAILETTEHRFVSPLDAPFFDGLSNDALTIPEATDLPKSAPVDALCSALTAELPGAMAVVIVDLDAGHLVGADLTVDFDRAFAEYLARFTTSMFRGEAVRYIEGHLHERRGGTGDSPRLIDEVVVSTEHTNHLARVVKDRRYAIVVVTPRRRAIVDTQRTLASLIRGIESNLS